MLDYFTTLEKYIGEICKNCKIDSGSDIFTTLDAFKGVYICMPPAP